MKRARFITPARCEFLKAVIYYNEQEAGLGIRFTAAGEEAVARALAFPQAGSPASRNTHRIFVKGFPFAVVYKPDQKGIVIFAIANFARFPEYWKARAHER